MTWITLDESVVGRVRIGALILEGLAVSEKNPHWNDMQELAQSLRQTYGSAKPSDIETLGPARKLYRAFGVDPTRIRPSSEALLRRVLQGKDLYQINTLVDALNGVSVRLGLPIGLYDRRKAEEPFLVRVGRQGEFYPGIRKADVHLEGRLVVCDALGPCGSPTSDSARTCIDVSTRSAVAVIFAPDDYPSEAMYEGVQELAHKAIDWCGGSMVDALVY